MKVSPLNGLTWKEVIGVVVPVIIDQFFLVAFNFLNTLMIAQAGELAISAVGMVGALSTFLYQFSSALGLACTVLMAQRLHQKGSQARLAAISQQTFVLNGMVGLGLVLLLYVFQEPLLKGVYPGTSGQLLQLTKNYFVGVILSLPLQGFIASLHGSFRGLGKTKVTLIISLVMNVLNLIFNAYFVTWCQLGIQGLVYSLLLSRMIALVTGLVLYLREPLLKQGKGAKWGLQVSLAWTLVLTAIPFAIETLFFSGGKIVIQGMVVSLGTSSVAANGVINTLMPLAEAVPQALSQSLVPLVGMLFGMGAFEDIGKLVKYFLLACSVFLIIGDLALYPVYLNAQVLYQLSDTAANLMKTIFLYVLLFHPLFWGISFVLPSSLRAMNDGAYTTKVSMTSMWLFRVCFIYLAVRFWGSLVGVFLVMMMEWGVRGLFFGLRFQKLLSKSRT